MRDIAAPLPMIVIGDLLGVEPDDHDLLLRWSDDLISSLSATATPAAYDAAVQAFVGVLRLPPRAWSPTGARGRRRTT